MNDDIFDDGDFEDGFDNGDFEDDSDCSFGMDDSLNDEMQDDLEQEDNGIDIGWEEIAIIGGMAEEFAEEEVERRKLEKKMDADRDQRNNHS